MSSLRTVVLFGFVSRLTIFLFVVWVLLSPNLFWHVWQEQIRRDECRTYHSLRQTHGVLAVAWSDDPAPEVGFNPCFIWQEPSAAAQATVLGWFFAFVGFVGSLIVDVIWWIRRQVEKVHRVRANPNGGMAKPDGEGIGSFEGDGNE